MQDSATPNSGDSVNEKVDKPTTAYALVQKIARAHLHISAVQKLVLICLADRSRMDKAGKFVAFPSIATLSEQAQCGERTVQRVLAYLESVKVIKREPRHEKSSIYRIDPDALFALSGCQRDTVRMAPTRVTNTTFEGDKLAPKEIRNRKDKKEKKSIQPPNPLPGGGKHVRVSFYPLDEPMCIAIQKVSELDTSITTNARTVQRLAQELRKAGYKPSSLYELRDHLDFGYENGVKPIAIRQNISISEHATNVDGARVGTLAVYIAESNEWGECTWKNPNGFYTCHKCGATGDTYAYQESADSKPLFCSRECLDG